MSGTQDVEVTKSLYGMKRYADGTSCGPRTGGQLLPRSNFSSHHKKLFSITVLFI